MNQILKRTPAFFLLLLIAIAGALLLHFSKSVFEQNLAAPEVPFQCDTKTKRIDTKQIIEDLRILSADDMQGRETGTPGSAKARQYIKNRFQQIGVRSFNGTYDQKFDFTDKGNTIHGTNILGFLPGEKAGSAYIVLSAHYDHLGARNGEIYNGADDNASGVGAILASAEFFAHNPPNHPVLFIAFDAEEFGLDGAKAFIRLLPVKKEQIAMDLNLDMVSRSDAHEIYVAGTYEFPSLKPFVDAAAAKSAVHLKFGHDRPHDPLEDWTDSSDHAVFYHAGIPFLYFGVEDHPDYHRPTDDFSRVDPNFYCCVAELILDTLLHLDQGL